MEVDPSANWEHEMEEVEGQTKDYYMRKKDVEEDEKLLVNDYLQDNVNAWEHLVRYKRMKKEERQWKLDETNYLNWKQ